jgi:anti-anti-sigma factor
MTAREATSFHLVTGPEVAVVEARGELDVSSSPAFRRTLEAAVATGCPLVVVDLAAVSLLDSAGLAVVFGVSRDLPVDQRLVLGNVPQRMMRVLRLAAVGAVVDVHPQGEPQPWEIPGRRD